MKKKQSAILKWLLLAVCLFAAGCFYSCGGREAEQRPVFAKENRGFQAESAPGNTSEETAERQETAEADEAYAEVSGETVSTGNVEDGVPEPDRAVQQVLCYVYICGEVQSPGVYTLPEGARIYEAVDLAGGFTAQAAESWLNLAEPVTDGMKLEVPSKAQVKDPAWQAQSRSTAAGNGAGGSAGSSASGQTALVNLNTASLEELMTLKGIGQARAEDIIRYRKEAGCFTKIEDIMKVPGIKDAAFQKIKDNITV